MYRSTMMVRCTMAPWCRSLAGLAKRATHAQGCRRSQCLQDRKGRHEFRQKGR